MQRNVRSKSKWFVHFECELFPRPLKDGPRGKTVECPGHYGWRALRLKERVERHIAFPYMEEDNG